MFFCVSALAMVMVLAAGSTNAGMIGTYVDATTSNTGPGADFSASDNDTDNLWFVDSTRTHCENGNVVVSNGYGITGDAEDSPTLTTTVSGLANGTYNVYAIYWTITLRVPARSGRYKPHWQAIRS